MKEKCLVIGGSGFIGSHVADALSERGFSVTIYDTEESLWKNDKQEFVKGDISDITKLQSLIDKETIVYNFAAIADIAESIRKPYETIETNIIGTASVLEALRKKGAKKYICASTMYVYGTFGSFYRVSKQSVESIVQAYSEEYGIEYILLRYGSLYGPRSQKWNGFRRYIEQIKKEGKLDYWGSGEEVREYIHVLDAARLSVDILENENFLNSAINLTGHESLTSNELFDLLFEIAGVPKKINYLKFDNNHGHYKRTPYRKTHTYPMKLVPEFYIDIGYGILEEFKRDIDS